MHRYYFGIVVERLVIFVQQKPKNVLAIVPVRVCDPPQKNCMLNKITVEKTGPKPALLHKTKGIAVYFAGVSSDYIDIFLDYYATALKQKFSFFLGSHAKLITN